jgi:hypothetical protein
MMPSAKAAGFVGGFLELRHRRHLLVASTTSTVKDGGEHYALRKLPIHRGLLTDLLRQVEPNQTAVFVGPTIVHRTDWWLQAGTTQALGGAVGGVEESTPGSPYDVLAHDLVKQIAGTQAR